MGPDLLLKRRYTSAAAAKDGPFGYGWDFTLDQRLQMYAPYDIAELRGDGGTTTFRFTDGTGGAFVSAFDGDSLIHRDLAQGTYAPDGAPGWSLTREAADRYKVTRPDGVVFRYNGYHAPWRTGEDPRAGRLQTITDRNGNALTFTTRPTGCSLPATRSTTTRPAT